MEPMVYFTKLCKANTILPFRFDNQNAATLHPTGVFGREQALKSAESPEK
jgi:hypothetical protein